MSYEILKKITLEIDKKISYAVERFNQSNIGILLVVDKVGKLYGTITDGDIRRGLIDKKNLDDSCADICNPTPVSLRKGASQSEIKRLFHDNPRGILLDYMPVVDENNYIIDLIANDGKIMVNYKNNPVIIMAGGLGSRLSPLTLDCPKPLLKISGQPILEILIDQFRKEGFSHFIIAINYLADMVIDAIGNGEKWGVKIDYVREKKRLGTAGPLALMRDKIDRSFIVVNSDILTKVNFTRLLNFHESSSADATLCIREHEYIVPYGVVELSDHKLVHIQEKPIHNCFISAGVYVFSPSVLQYIPSNAYFDMNELLSRMVADYRAVGSYPIHEYWLDIGRLEDLERAHKEYQNIFH